MRRTNIYLTPVQQAGFRRLTKATGQSMAALVRTAVNYMLAHPEHFPDLQGIPLRDLAARAAKDVALEQGQRRPAPKAPPKVKRTSARVRA